MGDRAGEEHHSKRATSTMGNFWVTVPMKVSRPGGVFSGTMKRLILAAMLATTSCFADAPPSFQDIPLKDIDGKSTTLKAYAGKVLLIVNVASECGNTPQYAGLQALYLQHKNDGLVVLGFPCNDFGAQEPGTNDEIKKFCSANYQVTFPMFDKIHVKGADQHPLYAALTGSGGAFPGDVTWNFGKFLVGKDGRPLQRFEPETEPGDPALVKAVEAALKK
jgi:glutathione peroxidase